MRKLYPFPLKIAVAACIGVFFCFLCFTGQLFTPEEREEEEGEGVPGIFSAMNLWGEMRTYPNKKLNATAYSGAFFRSREMDILTQKRSNGLQARTNTADWEPLAPMNFAGRILCIGFHPTNANIMYAGSASGGLWRTTVGGTGGTNGISWEYVSTGFPVLGVSSILFHPTDPDIILVGTGEVYNYGTTESGTTGSGNIRTFRGSYGVGILRSTDGGTTWSKALDFSVNNMMSVNDMVADPNNADIMYAATTDGVYKTSDAGASWTKIHSVVMAMDLCMKPGSSSVLYVGCGNFESTGTGLYKSTNVNTATPSFTKLGGGLPTSISGKIMVDISPNNSSRVYVSVGKAPQTSNTNGLYYSADEGASFTKSTTSIINNQGWYAHDVAVSRSSAATVFWAEMDVYRSTNSGSSFTKRSDWSQWDVNKTTVGTTAEGTANTYVHADIHKLIFSPHNDNHLYICTDGGIFRQDISGTNSYVALNGGLQTAQIYANMSVSQQDPDFMLGGMQDNEGVVYAGSPGCRRVPNLGDGFHTAIHPTDDDICFIASYFLNIKKSTNRAGSFTGVLTNSGLPPTENACFNAPFVIAPSTPSTMYGGTIYFKRSTNTGGTWSNRNGGNVLVNSSAPILTMTVAPNDANMVYLSTCPGGGASTRMYRTGDGGGTFTNITAGLPDRYFSKIAVDPANKNRVAVTLSGFGTSHVFLSHDGGANWSDIDGNLPDVPHNTLAFDPNNTGNLYVGNDIGVFYVQNLPTSGTLPSTISTNWTAYNEGFGDAILVSDIVITSGNELRMSSYGRGFWGRALAPQGTLPVKMTYFKGVSKVKENELTWQTEMEESIRHFVVEYSTDAVHFMEAGRTLPKANNGGGASYNFRHAITWNGKIYYRLKILNNDGTHEYSETINLLQRASEGWNIYPNPVLSDITVSCNLRNSGSYQWKVFDNNGRLLWKRELKLSAGAQQYTLPMSQLHPGLYQFVVEGTNQRQAFPFIKK